MDGVNYESDEEAKDEIVEKLDQSKYSNEYLIKKRMIKNFSSLN
jgi:uncharacterized protein (DUF1919 family)